MKMASTLEELCSAVSRGEIELVRNLLTTGIDPNQTLSDGCTPLAIACEENQLEIVKLLITNHPIPADPNNVINCWRYNYVDTNIFMHTVWKENTEMLRLLLTESMEKVDVNYDDGSALISSICSRNTTMVKLLLEAGADPHSRNGRYDAPLMLAISHSSLDICKLLVQHGCDVNRVFCDDITYWNYRENTICSAVQRALDIGNIEIIQWLVEDCHAGVEISTRTLLYALNSKKPDVIRYVLQHVYSVHGDDIWWYGSALHMATRPRYENCAVVLLQWGVYHITPREPPADIRDIVRRHEGYHTVSVFHTAARTGCVRTMTLLKQLYPQCLQENWLVDNDIPSHRALQNNVAGLRQERKHPPPLAILCRSKIFQQLGYNPIPKAAKLPLPNKLIDFVQCKDVFDM